MNLDNNNVLNEFKQITQIDIADFFSRVILFINNERRSIINFYNGSSSEIDPKSFTVLKKLQKELKQIFESFQLNSNSFYNSRWWDLLEQIELIDNNFNSLKNIHRWSRSSLTKFGYDSNIQLSYVMSENQTLEKISQDILLQENPNDQWYDIALLNDLKEEDYSIDGGKEIQLSFPKINRGLMIQSVMDVMVGKAVYGLDLDQNFQFSFDSNGFCDLKILNYNDTILQAVSILAKLKKNSNPDYPNQGLQSSIIIGGNRALMNYPIIIRQMTQTFSTDDTLKNFTVKNIAFEQDNLLISYEVETRLDEVFDGQISI